MTYYINFPVLQYSSDSSRWLRLLFPSHSYWLHYTTLHYTTLHYTTLHCTALHCVHCTLYTVLNSMIIQISGQHYRSLVYSAVQCSAVQYSAVQCSAVQCSAVQCSAVQCPTTIRLISSVIGKFAAIGQKWTWHTDGGQCCTALYSVYCSLLCWTALLGLLHSTQIWASAQV